MKTTKIHEQSHVGRLFRVLNMLQSVKYYRTEEIAEALGVSKRTVMRYIDDFRSAGFEIFIDRHCYRIDKRSGANKLFFNIISNTDEWQTLNNTEQFASAVKMKRFVRIEEYISAHSKTVRTRDLEPFEITEGGKFVWCYDPQDCQCKTFRPSRCKSVSVLSKPWAHAGSFRSEDIDIFGFHGSNPIKVRIELDIMARNLLLEEYPAAKPYITQMSESEWILSIDVYDLRGVGRFCMGLLKHIKIADTPQLKEYLLSEFRPLTE